MHKSIHSRREFLFFTLSSIIVLFTGCDSGTAVPSVNRTAVGDTIVVMTTPPLDTGPSLFQLERDLVIGVEDGPEEYILLRPQSVAVDAEGNIYTADQVNGEIRIYNRKGIHQLTFGRRGGGPGEFNSNFWGLFNVRLVPDGRITVEDLPNLRVFDHQGGYIRSFDLTRILSADQTVFTNTEGIIWLPEQGYLVSLWTWRVPDRIRVARLTVLDEELTITLKMPEIRPQSGMYYLPEGGAFSIPFTGDFEWCVTGGRFLVWANSDTYRLNYYDLEENRWMRAVLNIDIEQVTADDLREWKEEFLGRMPEGDRRESWRSNLNRASYPSVKPYFKSLLGDDTGRVWVLRTEKVLGPDGEEWNRYDLFDDEATWLGIVDTPVEPMYFRGDYAYLISYDPYPTIERYVLNPGG